MNLTRKAIAAFLSGMLVIHLSAAQDEAERVIELEEIVIEQSRIQEFAIGHNNLFPDSSTLQQTRAGSLAEMIKGHGLGHLRTYGPGGLATPSFRGTGSSQTTVLWNGINIQSPLSGQQDLSQIPVGFIDAIQLQMGGSASLFGNGAIGGAIHINNTSDFNEGFELGSYQNYGSFNHYYQDYSLKWSSERFFSSTRFFHTVTDNDFPFTNHYVNPPRNENRQNSAIRRYGLLQQNNLKIGARHMLGLKFWGQDNHNEVPNPISVNRNAEAIQEDVFYRGIISWQYDAPDFDYILQSAYQWHDLEYEDPVSDIYGSNLFKSYINKLELHYLPITNFQFTSGLHHTYEKAEVADFAERYVDRNRMAFYGAVKYCSNGRNIVGVLSMREEWIDSEITPFIPSFGLEAKLISALRFSANVSRNYRIPTFNDLYWSGAGARGNPNLNPEISWSEEAGLLYTYGYKVKGINGTLNAGVTAFSTQVDDWIIWLPVAPDTWTPQNMKKVCSRGLEPTLGTDIQVGNIDLQLTLRYSYTSVTNEEIRDDGNQNDLGKQLPYTPYHEGSLSGEITWQQWDVNAIYTITGKQYTDGSNTEIFALDPYGVWNIWMNRSFQIVPLRGYVLFEINNLLNRQYENRIGYPMPGRNYKIGLHLLFNKKQ